MESDVLLLNAGALTVHPALREMPEMPANSPEFLALVQDIADRGVDYPVIIDERDRVMDGRHRWRACKQLGIDTPCVRRPGAEVVSIVVAQIVHRRHYSKGALAYMTAPLFEAVAEEARVRRIENLKAGISRKSTEFTIGKRVEELAAEMGFSRPMYYQAKELRRIFEKAPEYRAEMEPKVLAGEVGLGAAIAGYGGWEKTKGRPRGRVNELQLLLAGFDTLHKRWEYWARLDEEARRDSVAKISRIAAEWPPEVAQAMAETWKREGKI